MTLSPGTRLGPYEISTQIGVGGMGEVYQATDTKLGRQVAIKVLPEALAADPDRLARFDREAKTLAALNHPNIAAIYGLEDAAPSAPGAGAPAAAFKALVMELVEGPTLADRIADGAMPVDEALPIARQIAEALEAAHEQGIIHRDLKPANVKVRPDGTVKVLDFGLAKAMEAPGAMSPGASQMPTITTPAMTQAGLILGTAAYMSPEQAKGRTVDARADVWAFGVVLFEMLSGQRAFDGEDITDVLGAVVRLEPRWEALPASVPARVRQVVRGCLQKPLKQRLAHIQDVRLALDGAFETVSPAAADPAATPASPWRVPLTAGVAVLVAVLAFGAGWLLKPADPRPLLRFRHALGTEGFTRTGRNVLALSPDGRRLAYGADDEIYLRDFDDLVARPIPGTAENITSPVFSPDGEWLAYFAGDSTALKKIPIAGGTPIQLTGMQNPYGMSWTADGSILYGQTDGIWRVSDTGGEPERIVAASEEELLHAPHLLPGGDRVLFAVNDALGEGEWEIAVQTLSTGERTLVRTGASPWYVPTGHLLFAIDNTLFAQAFDLAALEARGGPVPVVPQVQRAGPTGLAQYVVTDEGTLIYMAGVGENDRFELVLVDRSGAPTRLPGSEGFFFHPRFSPDGTRIAVAMGSDLDIWIYEIALAQWRQLTFEGGEHPVWTRDGRAITFRRDGALWQVPADFSGSPDMLPGTAVSGLKGPQAWAPDGTLLYDSAAGLHAFRSGDTAENTLALPLPEGVQEIERATFSPDGRWVAYVSFLRGEPRITVSPYPLGAGGQRRVTNDLSLAPVWSRSGELFFYRLDDTTLQVLGMSTEPTLAWTNPTSLFSVRGFVTLEGNGGTNYDVSADGQQFVMRLRSGGSADGGDTQDIQIALNWFEELGRRVPVD